MSFLIQSIAILFAVTVIGVSPASAQEGQDDKQCKEEQQEAQKVCEQGQASGAQADAAKKSAQGTQAGGPGSGRSNNAGQNAAQLLATSQHTQIQGEQCKKKSEECGKSCKKAGDQHQQKATAARGRQDIPSATNHEKDKQNRDQDGMICAGFGALAPGILAAAAALAALAAQNKDNQDQNSTQKPKEDCANPETARTNPKCQYANVPPVNPCAQPGTNMPPTSQPVGASTNPACQPAMPEFSPPANPAMPANANANASVGSPTGSSNFGSGNNQLAGYGDGSGSTTTSAGGTGFGQASGSDGFGGGGMGGDRGPASIRTSETAGTGKPKSINNEGLQSGGAGGGSFGGFGRREDDPRMPRFNRPNARKNVSGEIRRQNGITGAFGPTLFEKISVRYQNQRSQNATIEEAAP